MSQQVSYGTITIVDTNDIESITIEYNRNQSTSSPPAQSDSGWSTSRPTWAQGYYIWQRTRTHKSGTATTEDEFGTAVCITGSTGSTGQSLTNTKTQYTNVATNVTITTSNHTSYTWTDNVPSYNSSKPAYWGRITNTYSNPSKTEYIVYKDNGLTDAIAKSVEANANAVTANTNATEALNKANNGIIATTQLWYQTNSTSKPSVPTAHSQEVDSGTNTYNNWRTVRPTNNIDVYPYYYYCYEYKHGNNTYTYSAEAILDTSNLSQYQINALDTKLKAFFYPGDSNYSGAYAVANGSSDGLDVEDISTYGYNVGIRPTNISIGYDSTPVIQLDGSTGKLNLYRFPTISQGTVTQAGTLGMSLGTSSLTFYKPDGSTESAILNTNGLKISQGGLEAGTFNTDDYVYAWSTDRSDRSLAINDSGNKTDWRFLAGKKFGVDKAGNLYASNVNVSGKIKVGEGSNVYTTDNVNPLQIGGRNLSVATGTAQTLTLSSGNYWFTPAIYTTTEYGKVLLADTNNTRFTVSYDYSIEDVTGNATLRTLLRYSSEGSYAIGTIISGKHPTISSGSSSGHVSITFEPGDGMRTYGINWMIMVNNTTAEKAAVANATLTISNFKFEIGNKATDWTPAPEDIQAEIDAKKSIHTIQALYSDGNQYTETYANILAYSTEGRTGLGCRVASIDGIKIGDTVRLAFVARDMNNATVYIIGTVTNLTNGSYPSLYWTSHGLDTTVIDGGHILTGTIDANKVNVSNLTVGAFGSTEQNKILNENIKVGGRNLLLATPKDYNATAYRIYQLALSENLVVGETYTLQFWGVSLDSNSTGLRPFWGGGNNVLTPLTKPDSSGYWVQTFTVGTPSSSTEAANKWLAIYNAPSGHTGANGSISKWKLEKGNKATDWTPAPEDTINDNLVNGSQKMDGWKRNSNASLDTSSEFGDVTLTGSSSNWLGGILTAPTMRTSILDGSALWLSLEYKASTASTLHIEFSGIASNPDTSPGSQTKYRTWNYSVAATSSWTKLAYPMPTLLSELTGGSGNVNSLFVAFYNRTDNSTMHIRKVKLEHGLAPTEWTPSPEDFKTYITRIDDAGIRIHPSSTEDDSVVINSDAISMYRNNKQMMKLDDSTLTFYNNSGGVVATYGSSITLASNEASVTIGSTSKYHTVLTNSGMYFRNGANTTSTNLLAITGNKITLYKPNTTTAAATLDTNGLSIAAGSITLGSNFSVTAAGTLTATSGTIGGWGISSSQIYHYADSSGSTATSTTAKYYLYIQSVAGSNGGNYAFAIRTRTDDEVTANSPTIGSATVQFGVSWTGYMVAKNANITGTIVATSFTAKDSNNKTRAVVDTNGLNIYDTDGTTSVALFSATPRIGKSGSQRIEANSAGIEIYDTGNQRRLLLDASTGLIIGRSDKQHIIINDANVDIYNNASTPTLSARLNTDGLTMYRGGSKRAATTANGLDIFGSDGSTSIASFGNTIRLGKTTQSYLNIYTKGTDGIEGVIDFYKGSTLIGSIESTYTSSTSTINLTARHGSNIGTFSVGPTGANLWFGAPGNPPIDFGSTGTISANSYIESSNSNGSVRLVVDSGHRGIYDAGNSQWIIYGGTSNYIYVNNNFGPGTTSTSTSTGFYLGWSNYRWRGVYSYSAPNSVSDKKDKDIIGSINYAKELIMKLKPIEYQWKNSDHNRIHLGLIAQDVAKIGKELNKNLSIYEANYKNSEQKYHGEEVDDNELSWGMTYTELIAPMIKVIQEQEQRIQKLESIIKGGNVDVSD